MSISEELTRIYRAKEAIRASIVAKGVSDFPENLPFDKYADKIREITK